MQRHIYTDGYTHGYKSKLISIFNFLKYGCCIRNGAGTSYKYLGKAISEYMYLNVLRKLSYTASVV
jgi:hypothetical protein